MKQWITTLVALGTLHIAAAQSDIASFFSQLQTFSADFSQTVKQNDVITQQSQGKMWLKKPLTFRWNYATPEPMELVSDGTQFYHYDVDLAQVTVKPTSEVTDATLSTLFSDKKNLDEIFNIQSFGAPAVRRQFPAHAPQWLAHADVFYRLTAKKKPQKDTQATTVIIGLSSSRQLRVFYAKDGFGENDFIFTNINQNKTIDAKKFQFKAPRGVDVIGQ